MVYHSIHWKSNKIKNQSKHIKKHYNAPLFWRTSKRKILPENFLQISLNQKNQLKT